MITVPNHKMEPSAEYEVAEHDLAARTAAQMPSVARHCLIEGKAVEYSALMKGIGRPQPKESWNSVVQISKAIDATGCANLRNAVNASRSISEDSEPEYQLELSREELEMHIGIEAVAQLMAVPRHLLAQRADAMNSRQRAAPTSAPTYRHEIVVRRYCSDKRPWMFEFHRDACAVTVNVALASDEDHCGGRLLLALSDGLAQLSRAEGDCTAHLSSVLHAVSAVKAGVRYSLLIFHWSSTPQIYNSDWP